MRIFETHEALDTALSLAPLMPGAFRFTKQFAPAGFRCDQCGQAKPFPFGCGTGYAVTRLDKMVCYQCCGENDRRDMIETGKAVLYLTHGEFTPGCSYTKGKITNWPGTLSLPCGVKRGAHNIARYRYDAWFTFDGARWHGVQIGDNTQIIRCKRLKSK